MKNSFILSAAVVLGVPALSHAGFVASTNSFAAANTSSFNTAGNTLSTTTAGTLVSYVPDGPSDPQITTDLSSYRFTLNATAGTPIGNTISYSGTYQLYYDLAGGINVSSGTATFTALQTSGRLDILSGLLVQTQGPGNPAFTDLAAAYGNSPLSISGSFTQNAGDPKSGLLQINFDQGGQPVPEPATMAVLGLGALGVLRRRRA